MTDGVVVTLDVDWAPDFMIEAAASALVERGVPATWFVTHRSPAIERLREHGDLFELGIHPNFLAGSSHGATPAEVLEHCLAIVPEATSMRTHSLMLSTPLLDVVGATTEIQRDVSIYLPRAADVQPVEHPCETRPITRVPFVWEDDLEMRRTDPIWTVAELERHVSGLKVLDFHPVHIYLNSATLAPYSELKRRAPRLDGATESDCEDLVNDGVGAGSFFRDVIDSVAGSGRASRIDRIGEGTP